MARGPVGAFAEGFVSGVGLRRQQEAFEEEKQTNKLRREGLELELRKRRADLEDADRNRDADAWWAETSQGIVDAATAAEGGNRDALTGFQFKDFADFRSSRKASKPQPQQPQPAQPTGIAGLVAGLRGGIAPAPQAAPEAGGIAAPAGEPAEAPVARGVQPPAGNQPTAGDQPETPRRNLFIPSGAKAPDVYEQRIRLQGQALERYFTMKGQPEKALAVPATIKSLLKDNWEERIGTSVPMTLAGSRQGLRRLADLNEVIPNGSKMDPETGTFDEKSRTWKGVMVTNEQTGEQSPMDFTPEILIALTKRYDVAGAAKDIIQYGKDVRSEGRDERRTVATEQQAQAAVTNANANEARARAQETRARAQTNAEVTNQAELAAVRIGKMTFPLAGTEITQEQDMKFTGNKEERDAQRARLQKQIDTQTEGLNYFNDLIAGNSKVPKNTIADLAKKIASGGRAGVKIETDKDGREFVIYKGQKIYI